MNKQIIIVAGGPSLLGFDWDSLKNKNVMCINRSYEKCPNAKYLFFVDERFWTVHREGLLAHSAPHKITARRKPMRIEYPECIEQYTFSGMQGFDERDGYLRTGNNSGYAALSLAIKLGYRDIFLLGYDMKFSSGLSHWHSGHIGRRGEKLVNKEDTLTTKMLPFFQELHDATKHIPDLRIINTNRDSAITCFEFGELP